MSAHSFCSYSLGPSGYWDFFSYSDRTLLSSGLIMDPHEFQRRLAEVTDALESREYLRTVAMADQLIAEVPDDAMLLMARASALLAVERGQDACEDAQRAAEIAPHDPKAWSLLGEAAEASGRNTRAQEAFERACQLAADDDRPSRLADLAWFMAGNRGPRPAEAAAKKALAANPQSAVAWASLARIAYRQSRLEDAATCIERAVECDPTERRMQLVMLELLTARRQWDDALMLVDQIEDGPDVRRLRGEIQDKKSKANLHMRMAQRGLSDEVIQQRQRKFGRSIYLRSILGTLILGTLAAGACVLTGVRPVMNVMIVGVLVGIMLIRTWFRLQNK